jgi:hypothetical protein
MSTPYSVFMSTSGAVSQGIAFDINADSALRPQSTFGPKKLYSETAYDFPSNHITASQFNPPPNPISTRVDVKNNNMGNN